MPTYVEVCPETFYPEIECAPTNGQSQWVLVDDLIPAGSGGSFDISTLDTPTMLSAFSASFLLVGSLYLVAFGVKMILSLLRK